MDREAWYASVHGSQKLYTTEQLNQTELYSQQKQDWELTAGSDHEILTEKFRLKLKKAGEITRPLNSDLNQTP